MTTLHWKWSTYRWRIIQYGRSLTIDSITLFHLLTQQADRAAGGRLNNAPVDHPPHAECHPGFGVGGHGRRSGAPGVDGVRVTPCVHSVTLVMFLAMPFHFCGLHLYSPRQDKTAYIINPLQG